MPPGERFEHVVAAADVTLATGTQDELLQAYRKWLGIPARPARKTAQRGPAKTGPSLDPRVPVELVVLSRGQKVARCRILATGAAITLCAGRLWEVVPGEIVRVRIKKAWSRAGRSNISGIIESTRLDAAALGLTPLALEPTGMWDPRRDYEGEPEEPLLERIIAGGPRPAFEMEQVIPGEDPDDPHSDPILESVDRRDAGDLRGAAEMLMKLCLADLRCLDAHAHLGNLVFDMLPEEAIRHYEVGVRIGELSLGPAFHGVLPWNRINNRPFLRCLEGFGLCLWRQDRFEEAAAALERLLWLNPRDNQGARFVIGDVRAGVEWEARTYR